MTRRRSDEDERSVVISLTDKGRGLEKPAADMQEDLLDSLEMSKRDRLLLHDLAQKLCRRLP